MQHQRRDHVVERIVGERQAVAQVDHVQGYVVTEPPPCQRRHPGAGIDAGDNRTAVAVGPRVMRATYLLRNPAGGRSDY
ncbi:hypothetical protein ACFWD7_11365 [Streptomyces mirabilis]|uniref:hypothetical protein n=1 Tax=Streptomyces mirabilis TaxID=68239 RepID=UPI0036B3E8F5